MTRATLRQCITVVASIAAITVGLLGCHHAADVKPVPRSETPSIVVDDAFARALRVACEARKHEILLT